MPLFGRKKESDASAKAGGGARVSDTDWSDLDNVRAEWPSSVPNDDDLIGWQNGFRIYEQGMPPNNDIPPLQMFNIAEYMSRELRHAVYGKSRLTPEQTVETIGRVLDLLARTPFGAVDWLEPELAYGLIRLAFAIAKLNGWQPVELGGDGTIPSGLMSARPELSEGALSHTGVAPGDAVRSFFASPASKWSGAFNQPPTH